MMDTSKRFAAIRAEFGVNQATMAEKAGVQRDSWRRYESGALPNGETLERIAAMGFSLDWLLTGRGSMRVEGGGEAVPPRDPLADTQEKIGAGEAILRAIPQYSVPLELEQAITAVEGLLKWGPRGYRLALLNAEHLVELIKENMDKE